MQRCDPIWENLDFISLLADTIEGSRELYRCSRVAQIWRDPFLSRLWRRHGSIKQLLQVSGIKHLVRKGTKSANPQNITIDDKSLRTFKRYGRWTETLSGGGAWIWSILSIAGTPEECRAMWGSLERLHMHAVEGKLVQILDVIPASTFHSLEMSLTDEELLLLPSSMAHLPNIRTLILHQRTRATRGSENKASILQSLSTALANLKNLRTVWLPVVFLEMPVLTVLGGLPLLSSFSIRDGTWTDHVYQGLPKALRLLGREKRTLFPSLQTFRTEHLDPHLSLNAFRMSRLETLDLQITFCSDTSDPDHQCGLETFDHISQFKTLRFLTLEIGSATRYGDFMPYTLPPNFFSSLGMLTNLERLDITQNKALTFLLTDLIEATSKWTLMEELVLQKGRWSWHYMEARIRNLNILPTLMRNMPKLRHLRMCFDHFTPVEEPMDAGTDAPKLKKLTFSRESFGSTSTGDALAVAKFLDKYVQVVVTDFYIPSYVDYFWTTFSKEWRRLKTDSKELIAVEEWSLAESDHEEDLLGGLMG